MGPLTVIHLTSSRNESGGTRQAMVLLEGLREKGHRVVLCAPPGSPILRWAEARALPVRALRCDSWVEQWRASRRLRRIAGAEGAHLVHAHHTKGHNVAVLGTFGGRFPPVVANRGVVFRPHFPLKFRSSRTAAVITNSERVKGVLTGCGVPAGKVHVVYNGAVPPDPERLRARAPTLRRELDLPEGAPVVGSVGNGRPAKGFRHLVEAAPEILSAFPSARFVLVGGHMEEVARRVEELGLSDRFRLPGHRRDAVEIMGLFDLFVLPSVDQESCPNVVLEAMGAGLPVVGTDVGGVAELVRHGRHGLVVPPGSPRALAEGVRAVLARPEWGRALGRAGRGRAGAEFTVARKVAGTLAVYRQVLGP
ncbi:MAG: glycosyltransferase family 4 protein [Deferrisomatales bacterium]